MFCDRHCVACAVKRAIRYVQYRLDLHRRLGNAARLDAEVWASRTRG